jgi:hypothetical protein
MIHIRVCLVISTLTFLPTLAAAGAAEPNAVGIIMKVTGETDPTLPPREEIAANAVIKLAPGTELTFLHYPPTCELVTVAGGTLKLTKADFTTDGEVKSQQGRPCPRVYELSGTGGGWVARDLLRLALTPEIIFAGSRAGTVTEAAVYETGRPDHLLCRLDLVDHSATLPASAASLVASRRYVFRLKMNDGTEPVDYQFIAVPSSAANSLAVLHVE